MRRGAHSGARQVRETLRSNTITPTSAATNAPVPNAMNDKKGIGATVVPTHSAMPTTAPTAAITVDFAPRVATAVAATQILARS